jgi:hypothetical protein
MQAIRLTFHVFNSEDDVQRLTDAVAEVMGRALARSGRRPSSRLQCLLSGWPGLLLEYRVPRFPAAKTGGIKANAKGGF